MTQASDARKDRQIAEKLLGSTNVRTFEVVAYVSGFLEGTLDDWPAQIQDTVYLALGRKADEVQLPLMVVHSYCNEDIDSTDERQRYYVHVIASEIVARLQ